MNILYGVPGEGEQFMNAAYIGKLGYGRHFGDLTANALKAFLYDLDDFSLNLSQYRQQGNMVLFDKLTKELNKYG